MTDINDAFKKVQEMAAARGLKANIVWRDEYGAPSFLDLNEARLEVNEPKHATLFDVHKEAS